MKKITLIFALFIGIVSMNAQDTAQDSTKQGWTRGGNFLLTFNQSAFNNEWSFGGVSNVSANILVNYDMNYAKGDYIWDNKLIANYGIQKNKGDENFTKVNDRLELNSIAGKKAKGNWYYSAYFNMITQMDASNAFFDNGTTVERVTTSHFFSPVYFQAGPGMLWKKSDNLFVNMSPAASKLILVHDEFAGAFGTEAGKTTRFEIGVAARAYYKFNLMENVSMENLLGLYSNYLEDPQNVDIDYTMNLAMSVNKFLSANLVFQAIYDDNITNKGFQIRQAFGLGLNYQF